VNWSGESFRCDACKKHESYKLRKRRGGGRTTSSAPWCEECLAAGVHRHDCPLLRRGAA
jgi:hypothetical protein